MKHRITDKQFKLLEQASQVILAKRSNSSKFLNLFVFFFDKHETSSRRLLNELTDAVSKEFDDWALNDVSLQELSQDTVHDSSSEVIQCISVDSRRIEGFRDVIKQVLWERHRARLKKRSIAEVLTNKKTTKVTAFRVSDYGVFVPYIIKKRRVIRVHSFQHEPFYRYRFCTNKTGKLPAEFQEYLSLLFENCPNHLYQAHGFRASQQSFNVAVPIQHTQDHELIEFVKQSKTFTRFKSGHENVANFLLRNDPKSIACEIPVWIECAEFSDYCEVFHTTDPLTGHIDLVRYEDQKIGVWDYKPKAAKEVTATTQVFLYAFMLSVRTGIPLSDFICGYFDESDLYVFKPYEAKFNILWRSPCTKPLGI